MPIVEQTNEEYHSGEGYSKTTLHTAFKKTPFHARFGAKKFSSALEFGKASHIAILEPEILETSVTRGPADRRGNKWKDAMDFAAAGGTILLTESEYDSMLMVRDLAILNPDIQAMQNGMNMAETSAYHVDEESGLLLKTRPDVYNNELRVIADVKNMADASYHAFQRDVGKFGYHFQHASYSDIWAKGTELPVDGFFFIVFEKSEPPMVAAYELKKSAIAEGFAQYRAAIDIVAECERTGEWPGYPSGIQKIGLRKYDHLLTEAPIGEEMEHDEDEDEDTEELPE